MKFSLKTFRLFFNGKSETEIYAEVAEKDFFKPETQNLVWRHFPQLVKKPLPASDLFFVGLSKANHNPVLYYCLKERKTLCDYFRLNDTVQRVHSFYQHQEINTSMWVGVAQQELAKSRIESIRLYYYKLFSQ